MKHLHPLPTCETPPAPAGNINCKLNKSPRDAEHLGGLGGHLVPMTKRPTWGFCLDIRNIAFHGQHEPSARVSAVRKAGVGTYKGARAVSFPAMTAGQRAKSIIDKEAGPLRPMFTFSDRVNKRTLSPMKPRLSASGMLWALHKPEPAAVLQPKWATGRASNAMHRGKSARSTTECGETCAFLPESRPHARFQHQSQPLDRSPVGHRFLRHLALSVFAPRHSRPPDREQ